MDEVELLKAVQRLLKGAIPYRVVEGFEPDRTIVARPIRGFGRDGSSSANGHGAHAHHKPIRTRTPGSGRPTVSGRTGDEPGASDAMAPVSVVP